jgi:hypothetical protein
MAAVVEVFGELAAIRLAQPLADEQCRRMTDVLWSLTPCTAEQVRVGGRAIIFIWPAIKNLAFL